LDKIETVELIKDIAQQAKSVMNKYDRIQAQNDVDKNKDALSKLEAEKAYNKLSDAEKAKYKTVEDYYNQNKDYFYYVAVDEQLKTNRENNKNLGGMGSDVSKGIDSAISIVTGIITGNITGGLAGASAPWVAEQIKIQTGDNETARLISHAILGAVVAELQGNSGLAGGAGAVTGELAADIIRKQLYGKEVKDLTEAEKENLSALAQLATGLAVASVGGDVGDVSTGIAAGKNAVENNGLSPSEGGKWGDFVGIHHDTGAQYDAILDAYANGYLTQEETKQAFSDLIKGKEMPNGSDYAELWMRAPEQIGQYLPGPIGTAMAILAATDIA
ncbi:VENN motif pre-toxin domain-containing protein, partial [Gilliamella sp. G0441]|uniref:VENN motif pre-toxin domain-containing protein n=1 Tax=Gilliamella sp. G0441 TaxID=3384760 RepID=UPI003D338B0C